jgi:xanthine dehydrogenase accessory factor
MTDHSPLQAGTAAAEILDAQQAQEAIAVVAVVSGRPELVGRRVAIRRSHDGEFRRVGSFGDDDFDAGALELARGTLEDHRLSAEGVHELTSSSGETVSVYVEGHHPRPDLVIVGAGHIAQPLCTVGALLGFRVIIVDDRPDFATRERFPEASRIVRVDFSDPFAEVPLHSTSHVVLVTRGHKYDFECLRHLLRSEVEPPYVGMIGSRRRVRAAFSQLSGEGLDRDRLSRVKAPVGLDIGAETPMEIAVAVAAEIVLEWRGGSATPLSQKERILDRFFKGTEL